jgi:hypothetical protein
MMRGSLLFPTPSDVAVVARPELDLDRWPSWMRDALASQPETSTPAYLGVEMAPALTGHADVRKLTRMPSRS